MAQHVSKGDQVMVMSGDDRGRTSKVLRVLPKRGLVLVEGVNVHKRHVRPNPKNPQGGIIQKEMPINLSNVLPVVDGKPTRVRFQQRPDGSKVRVAARSGQTLGTELRKAGR